MTIDRSCPVCSQKNSKLLFHPKSSPGPVSKCLNCEMVFVARVLDDHALTFDGPVTFGQLDSKVLTSSDINDVKDLWEFIYLTDKESEMPTLRMNALDALKRIALYINKHPIEKKILDFGSGWGFFLATAKELGWDTYGLEPLPGPSVYARATFDLNIITDTLHENTYQADSFDVITSFQVFEHLPNPKEVIQNLHKILCKDGIVLIEVPNYNTWTMKIMGSRHRHFVQDHINFFSFDTLGRLFMENGFEIVDKYHPTRQMSIGHLNKQWLFRYIPKRLADVLQSFFNKIRIGEQTIGINLGDIITVVARKS